ncbi:MAG: nucleotidyltransferase family protein [Patescibacteria group bacterium]|nr:nucleotidyltransferase family protein [Patescibacteria group bacterium]
MQAIILVGGLGTRLRDVINDRPKPMAPVNGKPFLEYQVEFLKNNGIREIVFSTGYMSEKIEEHFGTGERHEIKTRYVKEKDLLGTGGAIKNAKDVLDDRFFALNGDSMFLVDLGSMVEFHRKSHADLTIALAKVKEKSRYGNVLINDKLQITGFAEKENITGDLINGGIYYFEKNNFDWSVFPEKFSIEKEFFPQVIKKNNVCGFASDSYFIDIGTIEDYKRFENDISCGVAKL